MSNIYIENRQTNIPKQQAGGIIKKIIDRGKKNHRSKTLQYRLHEITRTKQLSKIEHERDKKGKKKKH